MKSTPIYLVSFVLIVGTGLAACQQRSDEPTVGQQVDKAIASVEKGAKEAKSDIKNAVEEAKTAGGKTADKVEASVNDASITAGVNAALARDAHLSALKINVDTQDGRVSLSGKAPNEAARSRATEFASAVKGVLGVDNHLTIEARG